MNGAPEVWVRFYVWATRQWPEILTEVWDVAILRGTEQSSWGGCYGALCGGGCDWEFACLL